MVAKTLAISRDFHPVSLPFVCIPCISSFLLTTSLSLRKHAAIHTTDISQSRIIPHQFILFYAIMNFVPTSTYARAPIYSTNPKEPALKPNEIVNVKYEKA